MKKKKVQVFVFVKTHKSTFMGPPCTSISQFHNSAYGVLRIDCALKIFYDIRLKCRRVTPTLWLRTCI